MDKNLKHARAFYARAVERRAAAATEKAAKRATRRESAARRFLLAELRASEMAAD